jgi:hypothetical protein
VRRDRDIGKSGHRASSEGQKRTAEARRKTNAYRGFSRMVADQEKQTKIFNHKGHEGTQRGDRDIGKSGHRASSEDQKRTAETQDEIG